MNPDKARLKRIVPAAPGILSPGLAAIAASGPVRLTVAGQELTLFMECGPLFTAMLHDIQSARQRVWLETYIFLDDAAGQAIAEALKERARAGVDVRVLYDAIGSLNTPTVFFRELEAAGARVHAFHSLGEALWRFTVFRILNRRNHRKLLVVDDHIAYFGGMNIVDNASISTLEEAEGVPTALGWRDVHVRLAGPQHAEVAESFDRSWRRAQGESIPRRPASYRRALLAGGSESIQFFDSGPGLPNTRASRVFLSLFQAARRRITLAMAYFLPVGAVLRRLLRARKRGVRIRLVVPGESDVPIVQRATRHLYRRLIHQRFLVYERQRRMLHSKVLVVDDEWTVLGSCNLDARSLWLNLEFLAVIHSRTLARVVTTIVQYEMAHSQRITLGAYRERGYWQRFWDWLAWLVRWWL